LFQFAVDENRASLYYAIVFVVPLYKSYFTLGDTIQKLQIGLELAPTEEIAMVEPFDQMDTLASRARHVLRRSVVRDAQPQVPKIRPRPTSAIAPK